MYLHDESQEEANLANHLNNLAALERFFKILQMNTLTLQ